MSSCCPQETSGLRPGVVRKINDDRRCGAAHDDPSKRLALRRVDFHVRQEGGNMNEIPGLRTGDRFPTDAPANFADAGEDVGDRLLLPVMMYPGSRPRL